MREIEYNRKKRYERIRNSFEGSFTFSTAKGTYSLNGLSLPWIEDKIPDFTPEFMDPTSLKWLLSTTK